MTPTSPFEILRRQPQLNASAKFMSTYLSVSGVNAVAGTESAPRGLALGAVGASPVGGAAANDPESFDYAGPNSFTGHLTRRVVVQGLTLADRVFGTTSPVPVGVESAFYDGLEVTVEKAEEIEAEGAGYLTLNGTGALSNATAVGSQLTFVNGLFAVVQANQTAWYTLTANNLTATDGVSLRIRAVKN